MPLSTLPAHRPTRSLERIVVSLSSTAALAGALSIRPTPARAEGTLLAPAVVESQSRPVVSPDGRGAAIVSYKSGSSRAGAVHVGPDGRADGHLSFPPVPMPFELEDNQPLRATATSDHELLIVADVATSGGAVATRLRDLGQPAAGQPVLLPMPLRRPALVQGRNGRRLLLAMDADGTSFWTLRIAVLDSLGGLESATELPSTRQFFYGDAIAACSDGEGGALAAMPYYDAGVTGSKDIGMFRFAADGSRPWGDVVRPLALASRDQVDVQVVSDGAGGMLLAWTDPRTVSRSSDIYAHHVDGSAQRVPGWGFYGSPICDANGPQSQPRMTGDGTGGAWVVWFDQRASLEGDLRYTHVLGDGTLASGFTTSGQILCDAPGGQREAVLAGDGAGGVFVVWRDDRNGDADLYAQHILPNGTIAPGWALNGRAVVIAPGDQDQPAIAPVRTGRVIVAWRDARSGPATRIYTDSILDAATTGVTASPMHGLALRPAPAARGTAAVRVDLPEGQDGELELMDMMGRRLARERVRGPLEGTTVGFTPRLAPGLYFARLRSGGTSANARLTVLR